MKEQVRIFELSGKLTNPHLDIPLGTLPQGSYTFTLYKGQQRGNWRFVNFYD